MSAYTDFVKKMSKAHPGITFKKIAAQWRLRKGMSTSKRHRSSGKTRRSKRSSSKTRRK